MRPAKFCYPALHWVYLMYYDKNPEITRFYIQCELCNEEFDLFDTIVVPAKCDSRESTPHYFHI